MLVRISQILNLVSRFSDILEIIENCLEGNFIPGLNSNYFDDEDTHDDQKNKQTNKKKNNLSRQRKASKRENDK